MDTRHRTACQQCGTRGRYELLEFMWRQPKQRVWHWRAGYFCQICLSAFFDFLGATLNGGKLVDG